MGSLGKAQRCSAPAFPLDRWRDTRRPGRGSCRCRRRRRRRRSPGAASFTGCASEHGVVRPATRSSFRSSSRLLDDHFRFVVAGRSVSIGAQTKGGSGTRGQVPSSQPTSTVFLLPASRDDYTDDKEATDAKYTPTTTRPIRREKRRDQFHCRQPPAPPKAPADRRQPPVYPNSSPDHRACNSLTPCHCPHAVHACPSVDSGLEKLDMLFLGFISFALILDALR